MKRLVGSDAADLTKHRSRLPLPIQLAVPIAAFVTFGIHLLLSKNAPPLETHSYMLLFWETLGVSIVLAIAQRFWTALRRWMRHIWPIFTVAILLLGVWDVITLGFHLLPLPYFPGPAAVLRSLISDRALLLDSTSHSLVLLLSGYTLGVIIGLVSGVLAGLVVALVTHFRHEVMPSTPTTSFLVLGLFLGPILEESVFRGCLLPVLARTLGSTASVVATAVLFAAFHGPADVTHWVWFRATGVAYGWLRLASHTTIAAALMHATCNLTLFLAAKF